jgi:hypothetical protein
VEKEQTDHANKSSNGTGAEDTIARIKKWAVEEKKKCLDAYKECLNK